MSGYSGFFYRNDMPWGLDKTSNTASNWSGDGEESSISGIAENMKKNDGKWIPANGGKDGRVGAFSSVDQIYGLLYGLGMARTMLTPVITTEEIRVAQTIDKMMVGLIAQGMSDLKLIGCFEELGKVQGQWSFPFQNKLYDIAKQFGLKDMVDAIVPDASIKSALSSLASLDDIYHNIDCLKNNSFQTNNYLRLFSISPVDNIKSPLNLSHLAGIIGEVQNDLVVVGNIAAKDQKYSYGLSAALMNGDNDKDTKINKVLNNNCEGMKAKLATAPCCGPNIGITNFPTKSLATTTKDLEWLVGDSNDEGVECPEGEYIKGLFTVPLAPILTSPDYVELGNEPMTWNGIDYLLDYNLMLLTCEQEVKSKDWHLPTTAPTLKQPDPLTNTTGCEDDKFFLHINGPEEVCAGSDVNFSLSTANGKAPTFDGKWTGGGVVRKQFTSLQDNFTEPEKANFVQTLTTQIPTNLPNGATYTVSYDFSIWSSDGIGTKSGVIVNKSVSKTVKVVNQKPPSDMVLKVEDEPCTYTITVSCYTCPDGKRTIEYVKKNSTHTEKITNTNACGTTTANITVPKKSENCDKIPLVRNDENSNIKLEINFDAYTNFISTKTDRPYYRAFDCRLIDIQGRTITSKKYADSNISLDVAELDLLAGIYIFQIITNDGQVWSKKFVYTTE